MHRSTVQRLFAQREKPTFTGLKGCFMFFAALDFDCRVLQHSVGTESCAVLKYPL